MANRSAAREKLYVDILTTAIEGGINYWGSVSEYKWENRDPKEVYAIIHDEEDLTTFTVNIETIAKGFNALNKVFIPGVVGSKYINDFFKAVGAGDYDNADFDAEIADIILQQGIFGEVVYG